MLLTSKHVAQRYAQVWLSINPWPARCIHDNGGEFVGPEFQFLLQSCRVKDHPHQVKIHKQMQYVNGCIKQ